MHDRNADSNWHFRKAEPSSDGSILAIAAMLALTIALIAVVSESLLQPGPASRPATHAESDRQANKVTE